MVQKLFSALVEGKFLCKFSSLLVWVLLCQNSLAG